jgi:hypothetical protein
MACHIRPVVREILRTPREPNFCVFWMPDALVAVASFVRRTFLLIEYMKAIRLASGFLCLGIHHIENVAAKSIGCTYDRGAHARERFLAFELGMKCSNNACCNNALALDAKKYRYYMFDIACLHYAIEFSAFRVVGCVLYFSAACVRERMLMYRFYAAKDFRRTVHYKPHMQSWPLLLRPFVENA